MKNPNKMVDPRLVSYLREQLKAGYDIYTLRNHLINHGYSQSVVDAAVNDIYAPVRETQTLKHEIHLSGSTIMALGSFFAVIALIVSAFFFLGPSEPKQLLDLSINIIQPAVRPGQDIGFSIELSSMGAAKRYDVLLKYDIVKDKKIISSKEETIAVETKASSKSSINMPANSMIGEYVLKATAKYDGNIAVASDSFKVYGEDMPEEELTEIPEEKQENEEELIEERVEEKIVEEMKEHVVEEDDLSGLTIWEKLEKIKEISINDPEKAGNYCKEIENSVHKDQCFSNIAEATKSEISCELISDARLKDDCYSKVAKSADNYELCEKISTESRKDSCYMNFVMDGNYDVCDRIINEYLKQSCDALSSIGEMDVS